MAVKRKATKRKATKRKPSAKQIAWRKKFAKMAKAGTLKKKTKRKAAKRKTTKRNPARKTASRKATSRKAAKRKTFGQRKYIVRGMQKTRTGYLYYYLHGNRFLSDVMGADRFSKTSGEAKMRAIIDQLPMQIRSITLEQVRARK